jgi:cyclase
MTPITSSSATAASIFHFGQVTIAEVKQALAEAGHPVRLAHPVRD